MSLTGTDTLVTSYSRDIPLGDFCADFAAQLLQDFPQWEDGLELLMDPAGQPMALRLNVRSPNRLRNLSLSLRADEQRREVHVEFNGASEDFAGSYEALRYIGYIVSEEIVCVTRSINGSFDSCWLTEPGNAMRLVGSIDNKPAGCLSFFRPQRDEQINVTSWTGRMDELEHFKVQ